jgi:hypothetical protein
MEEDYENEAYENQDQAERDQGRGQSPIGVEENRGAPSFGQSVPIASSNVPMRRGQEQGSRWAQEGDG